MEALTKSLAQYMISIDRLCTDTGAARISDLASRMHVSKPSACRAVHQLEAKGLVRRTADRQIALTRAGTAQAGQLQQKYRKIRQFLVEILGVEEQVATQDAWAMEHVLSGDGYAAFERALG